ncbi:MAG TPA: CsgG/HfaB family protein [Hyphomicrobiales bacterium]|nr:CsgG/HfaB family protein [Hyphomicrobiales bacterium]
MRGLSARLRLPLFLAAAGLTLAGCATPDRVPFAENPKLAPQSPVGIRLDTLPPPDRAVDVAVYSFPDMTGKNEPNDNIAEYSRAVTQGAYAFVIDALNHAGHGHWFNVVERTDLAHLLQERQLIRATRQQFQGKNAKELPGLRFAGILIEGGIVGFDANITTGGLGANYLGIGADTNYRRDIVTVAMRAVSVQSGKILESVTTTKTVFSVQLSANVYKFVALDKLLQAEAGVTQNEPTQLAVREAIDLAVYSLIVQGASDGLWHFRDHAFEAAVVHDYQAKTLQAIQAMSAITPVGPATGPGAVPVAVAEESPAPAPASHAPATGTAMVNQLPSWSSESHPQTAAAKPAAVAPPAATPAHAAAPGNAGARAKPIQTASRLPARVPMPVAAPPSGPALPPIR